MFESIHISTGRPNASFVNNVEYVVKRDERQVYSELDRMCDEKYYSLRIHDGAFVPVCFYFITFVKHFFLKIVAYNIFPTNLLHGNLYTFSKPDDSF